MDQKDFKPYIPAEKNTPELTVTSVIVGIILAVVFGAANAYLGLRVGMTVSASIPAAVISMTVIRVILKKNSILESNMCQTIGSAGESLAAGVIFTIPALFLWANEGIMEKPSILTIMLISLFGGILGVLFMVPLRNALIVKEHNVLPYPEGTACADVLLAGEDSGTSAKSVFAGMGFAAAVKFLVDGLNAVASTVTIPIKTLKTELSAQVYPALVAVGYICGCKISAKMLAGGLIGWFVLIPAIVFFGDSSILFPATVSISELFESGGPSAIWSNYIRYIGAGAVAAAGMISLIKTVPLIISTFRAAVQGMRSTENRSTLRTEQDLSMNKILIVIAMIILAIWLFPAIPVSLLGAVVIVVFGFFFATVSSRMVGLVGSSNNPISGMAIATLLIATGLLKLSGDVGAHGMLGAISIGAVICVVTAIAGDTSQDLKTGYLLGATPKKQQIGEIIGVIASSIAIGGVLILLDNAWGFGSEELTAPQAMLMKVIVEGVMGGNLPWSLVFIGAFISIAVECMGISSLSVAIGLYLPLELSSTIMLGGLVRLITDKKNHAAKESESSEDASDGILFCSGMIAGEGIVGILLAVFTVTGIGKYIQLSSTVAGLQWTGFLMLAVIVVVLSMAACPSLRFWLKSKK